MLAACAESGLSVFVCVRVCVWSPPSFTYIFISSFLSFSFFLFLGSCLILDGNSQRAVKPTSHSGELTPKLLNLTGLHGPSIFAVKAKICGVLYNLVSSIDFDETSSYWSAPKSSSFLGFSLVTTW